MFMASGIGTINWIFTLQQSWPSLEKSPKSPEEEESSPGGILSLRCQARQPATDLGER